MKASEEILAHSLAKLANEARKTVTLRIKSCFPPRTTSTAPTAKYTSLETTAERENGSITLSNITTNFSVITTMAPADTNIDKLSLL
ncbi:hypothetical protein RvY_00420 [Ramazzottius varieornatus]|uniref:Uncharacterized protein n=1 Tax=Ramazzottius varieornatus TaxID=947166 RepID=A0A1D1UGS2_RAMVA|nr:hypothetical protein RvY_00420 [Ramazzottius varieornatus]